MRASPPAVWGEELNEMEGMLGVWTEELPYLREMGG